MHLNLALVIFWLVQKVACGDCPHAGFRAPLNGYNATTPASISISEKHCISAFGCCGKEKHYAAPFPLREFYERYLSLNYFEIRICSTRNAVPGFRTWLLPWRGESSLFTGCMKLLKPKCQASARICISFQMLYRRGLVLPRLINVWFRDKSEFFAVFWQIWFLGGKSQGLFPGRFMRWHQFRSSEPDKTFASLQ